MTRRPRVAVIVPRSPRGEVGGAEKFHVGLVQGLCDSGLAAELVSLEVDESSFEGIQEGYLSFYDLDVSSFDGVISTKGPAYLVRHPNHVCYLQHTVRVFYDMFKHVFPHPTPELKAQRDLIRRIDTAALQFPRTRKIFVIGHEVRQRLRQFNDLDAEVLYQSFNALDYSPGSYEHVFMPGRLHSWKRVDLVIEAMQFVKTNIALKISGRGEDAPRLKALAAGDSRISFMGQVSDQELIDLYARSLVVPFVPIREDFGLVTLEAFASEKPVITCTDSGEPARLIKNDETGFLCSPDPRAIADRIEQLHEDPCRAQRMGSLGKASIRDFSWSRVTSKLKSALGF